MNIAKIISGGQTGADRGALDVAIELGIPHGGWCPKGRKAEDGRIPDKYDLQEMKTASYLPRTEANVIDAHATLVFCYGRPTGGSLKTVQLAEKHRRPCLVVDLGKLDDEACARRVNEWLSGGGLYIPGTPSVPMNPVLNVAGSRESRAPGIQKRVHQVIRMVLNSYPVGGE